MNLSHAPTRDALHYGRNIILCALLYGALLPVLFDVGLILVSIVWHGVHARFLEDLPGSLLILVYGSYAFGFLPAMVGGAMIAVSSFKIRKVTSLLLLSALAGFLTPLGVLLIRGESVFHGWMTAFMGLIGAISGVPCALAALRFGLLPIKPETLRTSP